MAYAIVINLDHDSYPASVCDALWHAIEQRMKNAGFHCDGRTFTINRGEKEASVLARQALENLEAFLEERHHTIYDYIQDFYGYDTGCVTNFLLPSNDEFEVRVELPPRKKGD